MSLQMIMAKEAGAHMLGRDQETVWMDASLANELTDYCQGQSPREACGLLFGAVHDGSGLEVRRIQPLRNASVSPAHHFEFAPEDWIAALYTPAADASDRLIGIFHSHPAGPAVPSSEDLALQWPFPVYAIISLHKKKPSIRFFHPQQEMAWREQKVMIRNG